MSLLIVFIDTDYTFNLGWFIYQYAIMFLLYAGRTKISCYYFLDV